MSDDNRPLPPPLTYARWSARKRAARSGDASQDPAAKPAAAVVPAQQVPAPPPMDAAAVAAPPTAELPDPATLTYDSDFTVYMTGKVDESVKRLALRRLLRDPRFNVMDGLDVYIDDYTQSDPIPPSMLAELVHSRVTLDPFNAREAAPPPSGAESASPHPDDSAPLQGDASHDVAIVDGATDRRAGAAATAPSRDAACGGGEPEATSTLADAAKARSHP